MIRLITMWLAQIFLVVLLITPLLYRLDMISFVCTYFIMFFGTLTWLGFSSMWLKLACKAS